MKKDVRTSLCVLRARRATVLAIGVEASSVFSSWRVVGDGASHATEQLNVVSR